MKRTTTFLFGLLCMLCSALSCAPSAGKILSNDKRLPPALKGYTGGILIEQYKDFRRKYNDNMREAFEKLYRGHFVVTDEVSGKYDKAEYRFAVTYEYVTSAKDVNLYRVCIYDRKTQEENPVGKSPSAEFMESLAKAMEMIRGKQ